MKIHPLPHIVDQTVFMAQPEQLTAGHAVCVIRAHVGFQPALHHFPRLLVSHHKILNHSGAQSLNEIGISTGLLTRNPKRPLQRANRLF